MPAIVNIADFVKIGIMAAVFIWMANRILEKVGLENFAV